MADKRYGSRQYDWGAGQKVSYTTTDADSATFDVETEVLITCTTDCFITGATAPSAGPAAGSMLLPALTPFTMQVKAGNKLSFEALATGGDAYIVPAL